MKSKTLLYALVLEEKSDVREVLRVGHVPENVCVVEPIATGVSEGFEERVTGSFSWREGAKCIAT